MLENIKSRVAQLVPVHFTSDVSSAQIRSILEGTFADNSLFCPAHETWVVVDAGTPAEEVLKNSRDNSPFQEIRVKALPVNRGKTGAIRTALEWALADSRAEYFITRDCDGDNRIEDLPRLVLLADSMGQGTNSPRAVFGYRPSLSKPMNWGRLQWESITNQVIFDLTNHLLARQERTLEKNFWNQPTLDLQSGYRLYDRAAAEIAQQSLAALPDDRETYLLACEISPFMEISLAGGRIGQVFRSTQIDQVVSSYAQMDFANLYGNLLAYYGEHYQVNPVLVRQFFDNALVDSEAIQSPLREQMLECRLLIDPSAPELVRPPLL